MRSIVFRCALLVISACTDGAQDADTGEDPDTNPDGTPFNGACGSDRGLDLLWDIAHNDFSDFREAPSIEPGWVNYSEPNWPLLGFFYPPEWTATQLGDPSSFGVELTSPDGQSRMMLLYVTTPRGNLTSDEVVQSELAAFGAANSPTLCRDTLNTVDIVGTDLVMEGRAANGDLMMAQSSVLYDTGQFGSAPGTAMMATIYTFEGPAATFTRDTERVFIPVIWQLLIGDSDNQDTDGDGIYDRNDAFPNDPNRF